MIKLRGLLKKVDGPRIKSGVTERVVTLNLLRVILNLFQDPQFTLLSNQHPSSQRILASTLAIISLFTPCLGWWQEAPDLSDPAGTTHTLLAQQVDDPDNPTISFNLGIAAQEQQSYDDASRHFSLATELFDPSDRVQRFASYFAWGDTAAQQVLRVYGKEGDVSDAELDEAIEHATRGIERYSNAIAIDSDDDAAYTRKKALQELKKILEEKRRRRQKQQEQEKKQQEDKQKKDQEEKDQHKQQEQQSKSSQDQDDAQNKNSSGGETSPKSQQQQQGEQQKRDQQDRSEQQKDKQGQQNKEKNGQQQPDTQRKEKKQTDQSGQEQNAQHGNKQQAGGQAPQKSDKGATEKEKKQHAAGQQAQQKNKQAEERSGSKKGSQRGTAVAGTQGAEKNMAQRRAQVLLDQLDQQEAQLHKALLRQKSQQQSQYRGYNQW